MEKMTPKKLPNGCGYAWCAARKEMEAAILMGAQ
jgi:hypothetical protein